MMQDDELDKEGRADIVKAKSAYGHADAPEQHDEHDIMQDDELDMEGRVYIVEANSAYEHADAPEQHDEDDVSDKTRKSLITWAMINGRWRRSIIEGQLATKTETDIHMSHSHVFAGYRGRPNDYKVSKFEKGDLDDSFDEQVVEKDGKTRPSPVM